MRARSLYSLVFALFLHACAKEDAPPPLPGAEPALQSEPCKPGFEREGERCLDVDECSFVASVCGTPQATCRNLPGSYDCTCPRGYVGGGPLGIACTPRVVSGANATCVLPESGGVKCWGAREAGTWQGLYPKASSPTPEVLEQAGTPAAIALGWDHVCILRHDGTVACWGGNKDGQLGDQTRTPRHAPETVVGVNDVVRITAGMNVTCAVLRHGGVRCWGHNSTHFMLRTDVDSTDRPVAVEVGHVVQLAHGISEACALLPEGKVKCWGLNFFGQLARGTVDPTEVFHPPFIVETLSMVRTLSKDAALLANGDVVHWGVDEAAGRSVVGPTPVGLADRAVSVSSDRITTCALTSQDQVWCRGGALVGDGTERTRRRAVQINGSNKNIAISAEGRCLLEERGGVSCWGANDMQKLGSGPFWVREPKPVRGISWIDG